MEAMNSETTTQKRSFLYRAVHLYYDGFRSMSKTSRLLWTLALIKLFIMFAILKPFFFPNIVGQQGNKERQAEFVMQQITQESPTDPAREEKQ